MLQAKIYGVNKREIHNATNLHLATKWKSMVCVPVKMYLFFNALENTLTICEDVLENTLIIHGYQHYEREANSETWRIMQIFYCI